MLPKTWNDHAKLVAIQHTTHEGRYEPLRPRWFTAEPYQRVPFRSLGMYSH